MTARFSIVRIVGGSLQARTSNAASLYESGLRLRANYLWSVDGCTVESYAASDLQSVHFFATASHAADATDEVAVGTVQYDPATNRLRQLIVDPAHRRQNLGARMVDAVKTKAIDYHQRDCLKVHAWLDSAPFYARQGFVPIGDVYESNGVLCQVMIYDPKKKGSRDGYIS